MNKILWLLSSAMLACSATAHAQNQVQCPSHNPVTTIDYEVGSVTYDRDYSAEELTKEHGARKGSILGTANGDVEIRVDTTFRAEPYDNQLNQYCLSIKTVRATIYSMPKVYIASEFARGTCEYATTLKHELKHVKMIKRTHKKELPDFRKFLNKRARELPIFPPMSLAEINNAKTEVTNSIKNDLQNYMQTIEEKVELRQKEVDSKEEYKYVWQRCDKWDRE